MTDLTQVARAAQMRDVTARPSQRRSDEQGAPSRAVVRMAPMLIRVSDTQTKGFHGLASRTDTPYTMYDAFGEYTETVVSGAFGKTLAQDPDVPLVLDHVRSQVFARTHNPDHPLTLTETSDGLEADAPDPDWGGFDWLPAKITSGLINEMSFRFSITRGQWSPDFMEYHIEEVDIDRGDVAIVGYGANPYTNATLRTQPDADLTSRSDAFVVEQFRLVRAELRTRGLKPPMSLEDIAS